MLYGSEANVCWMCNIWLTCCETGWRQCWTHNSSHHFNHFIVFTRHKSRSDDISSVHTIYSQYYLMQKTNIDEQIKQFNKCSQNDSFIICSPSRLLPTISSSMCLAQRPSPWSDYRTLTCIGKPIRQYWSLLINDL